MKDHITKAREFPGLFYIDSYNVVRKTSVDSFHIDGNL